MQIFLRERNCFLRRAVRGLAAWFKNRGLRDIAQARKERRPEGKDHWAMLFGSACRIATRAGERRLIRYDLELQRPQLNEQAGRAEDWCGLRLRAEKTITYDCGASPVVQLMTARVVEYPRAAKLSFDDALKLDLDYFGKTAVPLVRIVSQANAPRAMLDIASLAMYVARVLLPIHVWTFRAPDQPATPPRNARLPSVLGSDCSTPVTYDIDLPDDKLKVNIKARLTRYRPSAPNSHLQPVLLIHGYSASGTTFAHPALPKGGLAAELARKGFDAWVLDLRSSCGLDSPPTPWNFEHMAFQDIPLAIEHIWRETGCRPIDIVAHCMGVAMLSLGLLGDGSTAPELDVCKAQREAMRQRIRRIVVSQVGPAVVMSPANTARAYMFAWLRHYVKLGAFEFRPANPSVGDSLLDRLLCAVPYPAEDFIVENPFWPPGQYTPWVGPRHRMDSLFGITFQLAGMQPSVLEAIDDFFGPIHLETTSQVIAFAREGVVTGRNGDGSFINTEALDALKDVRILGLHSMKNGLADYQTRSHLLQLLQTTRLRFESRGLDGMGHQDSLIGPNASKVYGHIIDFLAQP